MKNIAVILSGCGFLDGAEIRESVLTLLALDIENVQFEIFAPNKVQHHVVNHITQQESNDHQRNVLEESARIARGEIDDVANLNVDEFDALILPGGFGVAKNLSTFAFNGSQADLDDVTASKLIAFHHAGKPIGGVCISPALIALALGKNSPTLTIGSDIITASELEKLGAIHQNCTTSECVVDEKHKIITTPAYMDGTAKLSEIFTGISKLVKSVIQLA